MVRSLPKGDVTSEDIKKFRHLEYLYDAFSKNRRTMDPEIQAKCLLAFAHDYILIGMDEFSDQLMLDMDQTCPTYLEDSIVEHLKDPDFEKICIFLGDWYEDRFLKIKQRRER